MLIANIFLAGIALIAPVQDTWELKFPYKSTTKEVWELKVLADVSGTQQDATMNHVVECKAESEKGAWTFATFWQNLTVSGNNIGDTENATYKLNPNGTIHSGPDTDYRKMIMPFTFLYPAKPIAVGDKWEEKVKLGNESVELKYEFEAAEVTKLESTDVLKVKGSISEPGEAGTKVTGFWWLSRDGRIQKFSLKLTNYVVPLAGPNGFSATMDGTLKKS